MLAKKLQSALAGGGGDKLYVEDVFSTYLYTGNGSTQTITNGIDLAGEGGLVWVKGRSAAASHILSDTERGAGTSDIANNALSSNESRAEDLGSVYDYISAFNSAGFSVTHGETFTPDKQGTNTSSVQYASWTFRKAEKFFDVVTYTGTGSARTVAHNLGSVPGCIIVKSLDIGGPWQVYHRTQGNTKYLLLNSTVAPATNSNRWNNTTPTSTAFTVGTAVEVNESGGTYVAYLFAHNAGGFGDDGEENVISCGSFTTNGSGAATVSLGYEPQWIMLKGSTAGTGWAIFDSMRGLPVGGDDAYVFANSFDAEASFNNVEISATGFNAVGFGASSTYIYIAIRRGPMKTPESGTEVFSPTAFIGNGAYPRTVGTLNASDFTIVRERTGAAWHLADRLRGGAVRVFPSSGGAEFAWANSVFGQSGFTMGSVTNDNAVGYMNYLLRRAPGFFDVVCYTGTGSAKTVAHNLGVAPELMIIKSRSNSTGWLVYSATLGPTYWGNFNNERFYTPATVYLNNTSPTDSVFTVGTSDATNYASYTYVAYLFATVAGVSKVGSYTGTGTTQQINCGFSSGARFVIIKRTDSTGDWYVWDSARGIVAGNDPYLLLNSTAAEVTNTDYIDTYSAGFEISSTAPAAINASGGTFIFLAIA